MKIFIYKKNNECLLNHNGKFVGTPTTERTSNHYHKFVRDYAIKKKYIFSILIIKRIKY